MLYYNFCIPIHMDGRTAAEFAGETPPHWLQSAIRSFGRKNSRMWNGRSPSPILCYSLTGFLNAC